MDALSNPPRARNWSIRITFARLSFRSRRCRSRCSPQLRKRCVPAARGCRVIDAAKAKNEIFAITVNEDTILGVVVVDLERGAATVVN